MSANVSAIRSTSFTRLALRIALVLAILGLIALAALRWSQLSDWAASSWAAGRAALNSSAKPGAGQKTTAKGSGHPHGGSAPDEDAHAGHDHAAHGGGAAEDSIELSPQAQRSIGLKLAEVELQSFERTISIPAMIVERPGRSKVNVSAPLTGIVTKIYPIQGSAVVPGHPLFDLRMTHEELIQSQAEFLRTHVELDLVRREISRLKGLAADGAIAMKTLLERRYEEQKLQGSLRSRRQALMLHGISADQVEGIERTQELIQTMRVVAPRAEGSAPASESEARSSPSGVWEVHEIRVEQGQHVEAGTTLAVMADHSQLYIEGKAFEQDAEAIHQAAEQGRTLSAILNHQQAAAGALRDLTILYVNSEIDPESRTLEFYVALNNELVRDTPAGDGHRFIAWRYRPGQRVQLQVPVETWTERIVLPAEAVVREGAENYVFQQNGNHFQRREVHVEYRDPRSVVIANDGSLFPGDTVAIAAASQLQLAIKNKSGGAVDPHAGHTH